MKFEDAVAIVRKNYPNRLIWSGFDYKDKYIFSIAQDEKFVPGDTTLLSISVDKKTEKTEIFPLVFLLWDDEDLAAAMEKSTYVDITKEQAFKR